MKFKIYSILLTIVCFSSIHAMEKTEDLDKEQEFSKIIYNKKWSDSNKSYIIFDENMDRNKQDFVETQFDFIEKQSTTFVQFLAKKIKENKFFIEEGKDTLFSIPNKLSINFEKIYLDNGENKSFDTLCYRQDQEAFSKTYSVKLLEESIINTSYNETGEEVPCYQSVLIYSPFWLTIAHELIHFVHSSENLEDYKKNNQVLDLKYWKIFNTKYPFYDKKWSTNEEQLTVSGRPLEENLDETTIGKHIS